MMDEEQTLSCLFTMFYQKMQRFFFCVDESSHVRTNQHLRFFFKLILSFVQSPAISIFHSNPNMCVFEIEGKRESQTECI